VTWAISVPISVFLGLSVLDLGPMYATGRQTDVRRQTIIIIIIIMFTKQGIGDALGIKIIIIVVVVVVVVVVVIGQIAPAVSAKLEGSDHASCQ